MSFTSDYAVDLPYPVDECWARLSKVDTFCDFMRFSEITKSIEVTAQDTVHLNDDLEIADEGEQCIRLHFNLIELITYLGISKDIPVIGTIIFHESSKTHIDHRVASGGLVTTHNTRTFRDTDGKTKIEESLQGSASWYLKLFTESEATRSHKRFMNRYEEFMKRPDTPV